MPRIPITTAQREAVYDVSPTASLLAPRLEDPTNAWRQNGCATPPDCDYAGGWMPWALREAAATTGAYASAPQAQAFFRQIAQDVATACSNGRLSCRAALPGTVQSLQRLRPGPFLDAWGQHALEVLTSAGMYDQWPEVLPVPDDLRAVYVAASPAVAASAEEAAQRQARLEAHRWPFQVLAAGYTVLLPLAIALGLALLALAVLGRTVRARRTWPTLSPLAVLAAVLLFAALIRLTMVAVVDVAEFEPDNARYTMPAHTLLVAFAAVVVAEVGRLAGEHRRRG